MSTSSSYARPGRSTLMKMFRGGLSCLRTSRGPFKGIYRPTACETAWICCLPSPPHVTELTSESPVQRRNIMKEQLLAKVYELAKESGYKLKPSSIRKVSATRRQQQQQHSKSRRPAADKGIASAVRDLAASEIATESDGTDDGGSMAHEAAACEDDNLWSTNVYDVAEVSAAEPLHNDYEVLAAAPRLDASASVAIVFRTDFNYAPIKSSLQKGATELVVWRGKRHADPHLQFLEKRIHVEKGAKAREMELEKTRLAIENRRLLLEENRLSFEREQFLQRTREWEAAQDQRKEEREMFERQQQALLDAIKSLAPNFGK
ncbi:hypothetical protein HPB49_014490 [Dermacentor silvarum]|uniref:Uncharacterized protein n=1 Tax=Dermacentor silvarum TaxID=543639 RepID=A0ACB8E0I6_DERSI|nr:hypothetical protein HPB49_014490 [Dermacentor silvarum]